jgi:hypothetical protein
MRAVACNWGGKSGWVVKVSSYSNELHASNMTSEAALALEEALNKKEQDKMTEKKIDDGGPAYPNLGEVKDQQGNSWPHLIGGLTKREYFAGKTIQGTLANGNVCKEDTPERVAEFCVQMADALLAELKKGGGE